MPPDDESGRAAIGLYAVLERDACDFIDMLAEHSLETLQTLHDMLTIHNPKHDTDTRELNSLGAGFVRQHVENRFGASPEPVERLKK